MKTKVLISCMAVTVQLICAFVFAYAKSQFSIEAAHICPLHHPQPQLSSFEPHHDKTTKMNYAPGRSAIVPEKIGCVFDKSKDNFLSVLHKNMFSVLAGNASATSF